MRPSESPLMAPPPCKEFPLPPGKDGRQRAEDAQGLCANDRLSWVAGDSTGSGLGNVSATVADTVSSASRPIFVQEPHTLREEYANAAIQSTAEHWVHEHVRREAESQFPGMEGRNLLEESTDCVGGRAAESPPEFVTGSPKYVLRLVLLLAVGLFGAIPLMSSFALTVLLTGCILTYLVDFTGHRRLCVLAIMCTTGAFSIALFLSNLHASMSSMGPLCMLLSVWGLLLSTTMATLLHFHWIQLTYPELIILMERCVLVVTPLFALSSVLSTVTAFVGSRHGPAWFLLCMCVLHYYFYGPMKSGFLMQRNPALVREASDEIAQDDEGDEMMPLRVNERFEAITFTVLLLLLPSVLYISFQSNWADAWLPNSLNVLGMFCGSVLYICWDPERSLWFLLPERQESLRKRLERDPLGVHEVVGRCRGPFLIVGGVFSLHWCIYRLLHSRYRFLFNGVPPPFNAICLAIALYAGIYTVYQIKVLLDVDRRGESTLSRQYLKLRAFLIGAAAISCVCTGIAAGLPAPFLFLSVLCVTSLNFFLLDRANIGPMISFTVFSSLLLMWWMYRMYSFIVLELHVLGESTTVPTPVLALNVLWCYVLGCIAFMFSFSKSAIIFLTVLFLQSLQVAWVEHVLYSQKEENVYPAVLVLFTTAVGVFLASRLYKNEKLSISEAALISASYFAKLPTFVVEVTGSYYISEYHQKKEEKYRALEITVTWWAALIVGYVVVLFELERGKQMVSANARRFLVLFLLGGVALTLCTARNFQRAVFEFLTQSNLVNSGAMHVVAGTSCVFLSIITYPFFARHAELYTFLNHWKVLARGMFVVGLILLITQPTRIAENGSVLEYDVNENISRYLSSLGAAFLVLGCFVPMGSLHFSLRALYWLVSTCCLSAGLSMFLVPVPSLLLFCGICGFVFFSLLSIDIAHFRSMASNEELVVYGVSICFMVFSFIVLSGIDVGEYTLYNPVLRWEIYSMGRLRLLSVVCVTCLFTAIILKFRLDGKSLLPGALPLTTERFEQVGLVVNYATSLTVTIMTTLNIWCNRNEPGLHVVTSLFLLLLVDDNVLFEKLGQGNFRYFPPLLYTVSGLWVYYIYEAYTSGLTVVGGIWNSFLSVIFAAPVIPSHVSLLLLLWFGKKRGGTPLSAVLLFVTFDVICLLLSSCKSLQWMAIVGVCGQCARLFSSQFWKRRLEMAL